MNSTKQITWQVGMGGGVEKCKNKEILTTTNDDRRDSASMWPQQELKQCQQWVVMSCCWLTNGLPTALAAWQLLSVKLRRQLQVSAARDGGMGQIEQAGQLVAGHQPGSECFYLWIFFGLCVQLFVEVDV